MTQTVTTLPNMASTTPATIAFTMQYTYDWLGRMQTMTFPNWIDQSFHILAGLGELVTYTYDRGGNIAKITGFDQTANPQQTSTPRNYTYLNHIRKRGRSVYDRGMPVTFAIPIAVAAAPLHAADQGPRPPATAVAPACRWLNASPTRSPMLAVWRSAPRVLAVGVKGAVVRSNDDGASWTVVPSDAEVDLQSIVRVGSSDIYALGETGGAVSRDGGNSFSALRLGTPRPITASLMSAPEEIHLALCPYPIADRTRPALRPLAGVIVRSIDHGRTFIPQPGTHEDCWTSIATLGDAGTFAIGAASSIARYAGNGVWEVENDEPVVDTDVDPRAKRRGAIPVVLVGLGQDEQGPFVLGQHSERLRIARDRTTTVALRRIVLDGRPRWVRARELPHPAPSAASDAQAPRRGGYPGAYQLNAASFMTSWERAPGDLVGVGGAGFGRSLDGGRTWSVQSSSARLVGIAHDGPRATAVGYLGQLLRTDDGGRTWRASAYGTHPDSWRFAWGVSADDFIVGPSPDGHSVHHTRDGGRTWQPIALPITSRYVQTMTGVPAPGGVDLYAGGWGTSENRADGAVFRRRTGDASFDGRYFSMPSSGGGGDFGVTGVWASSPQDVWACDSSGNLCTPRTVATIGPSAPSLQGG